MAGLILTNPFPGVYGVDQFGVYESGHGFTRGYAQIVLYLINSLARGYPARYFGRNQLSPR